MEFLFDSDLTLLWTPYIDFIGTSSKETFELAEKLNGKLISELCQVAAENKIWLSLGGFHQRLEDDSRIANTHVLINENGDLVTTYDKVHLFDAPLVGLEESKYVRPGNSLGRGFLFLVVSDSQI